MIRSQLSPFWLLNMSFIDYLDRIEDHRKDINKEYNLDDMIF
uniref:Uncharacterized protein n=1 Tax=Rheinheimera sp. BAL341 TaxID=1708203 RepID=A0A486XVA7_9GAMM